MQDEGFVEDKRGQFQVLAKSALAILCVLQMWYLALESYRHWHTWSPSSHALIVAYFLVYPAPLLLLIFKRSINPFFIAVLVYVMLGAAAILIFPTSP